MDREWHKPALLIYRDGRIWPTNRLYQKSYVELVELGSPGGPCLKEECVIWHRGTTRQFSYRCEGGPYAVEV